MASGYFHPQMRMASGSRSKTASRRPRRPLRSRRSRPASFVLIVLAIPLLAFLLYLSYRALRQHSPVVSLQAAIESSDLQIARQSNNGDETRIESRDSLASVERRLGRILPDAVIVHHGDELLVTRPGESGRVVIVHTGSQNPPLGLVSKAKQPAPVPSKSKELGIPVNAVHAGQIVLILDDVGFDNQPIEEATSIPASLNFAVIPRTPQASQSAALAHQTGHEVLCHLPMEPIGYPRVSPGAGAILTSMSDADIRTLTAEDVRSIPFAQGVNNHMGSKATTDSRVMNEMLRSLPPNIYFIDSRTTKGTLGSSIARSLKIRTASRDVFLDDSRREADIRRQLAELAAISSRRGVAVGIGHMYPSTVRVLQEEVPRLQKQGYRFVRASEIVQ